jgi:hypothetical protein
MRGMANDVERTFTERIECDSATKHLKPGCGINEGRTAKDEK